MIKITPFGANVLVLPSEKKQVLLSDMNMLCEYGTVVAVGSDVKYVKVGQQIGYTIWGVNRLEIEDKKYYFIPEDSRFILGIIENDEQPK